MNSLSDLHKFLLKAQPQITTTHVIKVNRRENTWDSLKLTFLADLVMNRIKEEGTEEEGKSTIIVAKQLPAEDWSDIKGYMRIKEQKLLSQFHATGNKVSNLFKGVSIYVNGFTEPSADELKILIHDHGGMYCYHYSPSKVTHVITCNLPDTKVKNLNSSVIVCTPSWIVDSIAAERMLPVTGYRLYAKTNEQSSLNFGVLNQGKEPASGSAFKKAKLTGNDVSDTSSERTDMPTTNATNLISEFYTHSRLHHLSQWSTELKEFTTRMRNQITPKLVKLLTQQKLKKDSFNVFVHIDLDCFFVSVGLRDRPQLLGKPVAVSHFKGTTGAIANAKEGKRLPTESMSDIASCNYEAREKGVRNGMSVRKGLQQCSRLLVIPYEFEKHQNVSHTFYETLLSFLPEIEAVSCDEAYLELTDYVAHSMITHWCSHSPASLLTWLRKTAPGTEFFNVTATDADLVFTQRDLIIQLDGTTILGPIRYMVVNGRITHSIIEGNELEHFRINNKTGTLLVGPGADLDVDKVTEPEYNLTVMIVDGGGLNNTAEVMIIILDINDNTPMITYPVNHSIAIQEYALVGFVILDGINATDVDFDNNSEICFIIVGRDQSDRLQINSTTGKIWVTSRLDCEISSILIITIIARDLGTPPMEDTINIIIILLDVNDYVPTFVNLPYVGTVTEEELNVVVTVAIEALDLDEGNEGIVNYSIVWQSSGNFSINAITSKLKVIGTLDREESAIKKLLLINFNRLGHPM